jgi:hypothetical protein
MECFRQLFLSDYGDIKTLDKNVNKLTWKKNQKIDKKLMSVLFTDIYKSATKASLRFSEWTDEASSDELQNFSKKKTIFMKYSEEVELINNWEQSCSENLENSEFLSSVISGQWSLFCKDSVSKLENSLKQRIQVDRFFQNSEQNFGKNLSDLVETVELNMKRVMKLQKLNEANLDSLKLEQKEQVYVDNYSNEMMNQFESFVNNCLNIKENDQNFVLMKLLTILTEVQLCCEKNKAIFDGLSKNLNTVVKLFWNQEKDYKSFRKQLTKFEEFCLEYSIGNKTINCILNNSFAILLDSPETIDYSEQLSTLKEYIQGKNISLNPDLIEIRTNCSKTIPFFFQGSSETVLNSQQKISLKIQKFPKPPKIDYLKHLNF